ncbi:MAG: hypothetical protein ACI30S_00590 [Muribaculaceae bacterium]
MKLKLFLIAASAMALASCSSDEVVKCNEDANAIKFSVVANNAGRAADYWCNLNKPTEFQVWAKFDNKSYFAGDWFSNGGSGDTYTEKDNTLRYWPQVAAAQGENPAKPIDFYAAKICAESVSPDTDGKAFATANWTDAGVLTLSYDMNKSESENYLKSNTQHDLLYAYAQETTKPAFGGTTNLNFRHALSQIVFKAKNTNSKIYVEITEVKVGNAIKSGVFSYPSVPTTTPIVDHEQGGSYPTDNSVGSWTNSGYATFTTGETFTAAIPYHASNVVNLTNNSSGQNADGSTDPATPEVKEANYANSFLLIPTKTATTEWKPADASAENKVGGTQTGSYFAFKAKIWNVSGETVNKDENGTVNETVVYEDYLYIPYSFNWAPGKKYIYTIDFTASGHGGFEDDGDEVLIPIKFTVSVDDFADATNTEVSGTGAGL